MLSGLNANQRTYFFALVRGEDKEEAVQEAGVSRATVDSWPYQGVNKDAFKRVRDILRDNPRAKEHALDFFIRIGTKLAVGEEVWKDRPRADVLRLGAEMSGALDRQTGPQIVQILLSDTANQAWVQAIQQKQQALNTFDVGEFDDDESKSP